MNKIFWDSTYGLPPYCVFNYLLNNFMYLQEQSMFLETTSSFIICLKKKMEWRYVANLGKVFSSLFHWEGKVMKNFIFGPRCFHFRNLTRVKNLKFIPDGCALSLGRHCATYDQRENNSKFWIDLLRLFTGKDKQNRFPHCLANIFSSLALFDCATWSLKLCSVFSLGRKNIEQRKIAFQISFSRLCTQ